jgi:flagellar biosynthetic protein FliR
MNLALSALLNVAPDILAQFFLVFLRVSSALFVLPVLGETMVPNRVRLAVAFAFSLVVYPAVLPMFDFGEPDRTYLASGFGEILTGLLIGLMLRLHVMAIQIAASIAAQTTSLSQLLGDTSIDPQPAMGLVLYLAALALAVELGLHVQFARMFIFSYNTIPFGQLVSADVAGTVRDAVSVAFRFGLALAAPFVAVSLLYNLALGVINRAMPQLMVAFVGAPAITFGALLLLALTAPYILTVWVSELQNRILDPFGAR